jgi:serine/threonine-protein kinase RsbT
MSAVDALRRALSGHLSPLSLESVLRRYLTGNVALAGAMASREREQLAEKIEHSITLFSTSEPAEIKRLIRVALELEGTPSPAAEGAPTRQELAIRTEIDVNVARSEARRIAISLGLRGAASVKVATAVSELARNIVLYAGTGAITIEHVQGAEASLIRVTSKDEGPGIEPAKLELILDGRYVSKSGLGKGIGAVRRIADHFDITSKPGFGTTIVVEFRSA